MGLCAYEQLRKQDSDAAAGVETKRSDQETGFTAHLAVDCEQDDTGR